MKKRTQILAKQNPWQRLRIRMMCKIEDQVIQMREKLVSTQNKRTI